MGFHNRSGLLALDYRNEIFNLIDESVKPYPKPAVYISGGVDSTILLHHLSQKTTETICTFTWAYGEDNELESARLVAERYQTKHTEVIIKNFLDRFPDILSHYPRPFFFLQPYWLAEAAHKAGRESCYNANGLDEHFGGYWYKPELNYIQSWVDYWVYVTPTFEIPHKIFGIKSVMPFGNIDFQKTLPYWDKNRDKSILRKAYKGVLPDFVVSRKKRTGAIDYDLLWQQELSLHYPHLKPKSKVEIREILNEFATKIWLDTRKRRV